MTNKILFVAIYALFTCFLSCKEEEKELARYTLITGEIENPIADAIHIKNIHGESVKAIAIKNGKIADTLKLKEGRYYMDDGKEFCTIYVKHNKNIHVKLNSNNLENTIIFSGSGAGPCNYFAQENLIEKAINIEHLISSDSINLLRGIQEYKTNYLDLLYKAKGLDSITIEQQQNKLVSVIEEIKHQYEIKKQIQKRNGTKFLKLDFKDVNDQIVTSNSTKGTYVMYNIWASWCEICKQQMNVLEEVKPGYKSNIKFVNISIDDDTKEWKDFLKTKKFTGLNLHFNNNKDLLRTYQIEGIPRHILVDPNGVIVDSYLPKPTSKYFKESLDVVFKK